MRPLLSQASLLRPLPLAILAMALLIVFKLSTLTQATGGSAALASAGRSISPPALVSAASAASSAPAPHDAPAPAPAPAPPPEPAPPAEPPISGAERALLQDLRSRRTELDARADALTMRERLLAAAEARVSERVQELAAMQKRLEALDNAKRERDEANWQGLVKTYEVMRPRDAAAIFNDLDEAVLMQVLDRMKAAKAALILGAMQPERARAATAHLAEWRQRAPAEAK